MDVTIIHPDGSRAYAELKGEGGVYTGTAENLIVGERGDIFRITVVHSPYLGPLPTPKPRVKPTRPYYRKFAKSKY